VTEQATETTETTVATQTTEAVAAAKAPDLPQDIQDKLAELDRLKSHHSKLLDETKTAKQRSQELEDASRQAEEKRQKENGEFQSLYETERERAERFDREIKDRDRKDSDRELKGAASKLVSELTRDTKRAELLSEKAEKFARHTENGVVYEMGGVQVEPAKVVEYLKENYPFLTDGSGASGGGASGSGRPSGAGDSNAAADAAKSKGDLTGFLTAQLKR
jgi:uncharacterized NAD(P)/FAD-binding protein YdhS